MEICVIETMAIICHKWIERDFHPSSIQEEPTEIATLTEAKENIKETRIFIQGQVLARGLSE